MHISVQKGAFVCSVKSSALSLQEVLDCVEQGLNINPLTMDEGPGRGVRQEEWVCWRDWGFCQYLLSPNNKRIAEETVSRVEWWRISRKYGVGSVRQLLVGWLVLGMLLCANNQYICTAKCDIFC